VPRNVQMDYEAIEATSSRLDRAVGELVPQLEALRNDVDALLGDGLLLTNTSPALKEQYNTFHLNLTNAINGIKQFADQFRGLKKGIEEMDMKTAADIRASTAQMTSK